MASNKTNLHTITAAFSRAYQSHNRKQNDLDAQITTLSAELEKLQAQKTQLFINGPDWIKHLLCPVIENILTALPDWQLEDENFRPMGMASRIPVFFIPKSDSHPQNKEEDNSIYIVFRHGALHKGELLYETGETKAHYAPGSMGDMNGLNQLTQPLNHIEQAVQLLRSQIGQQTTNQ